MTLNSRFIEEAVAAARDGLQEESAPVDRDRAQAAVARLYESAGVEVPEFIWFDDPRAATLAAARSKSEIFRVSLARTIDPFGRAKLTILDAQRMLRSGRLTDKGLAVRAATCSLQWASLELASLLRSNMTLYDWDRAVKTLSRSGVESGVEIADSMRLPVHLRIRDFMFGSDFIRDTSLSDLYNWRTIRMVYEIDRTFIALGLRDMTTLKPDAYALARDAWPCFLFHGLAIMSERPAAVHRDLEGRLHRRGGPAVSFPSSRDGGLLYWRGTLVPKEARWAVLRGGRICKQDITWISDPRARHIICEASGWDRVLRVCNSEVIDVDTSTGLERRLWRVQLGHGSRLGVIELENGTVENGVRRKFYEPVPWALATCADAVAWQYGLRDIPSLATEGART